MATRTRVIGPISAYAIAVSKGYTGTEEEFAEEIANASTNAQTASDAAEQCVQLTESLPSDFTDVLSELGSIGDSLAKPYAAEGLEGLYVAGNHVTHDSTLFRCYNNINTAGAWDTNKGNFAQIPVGDETEALYGEAAKAMSAAAYKCEYPLSSESTDNTNISPNTGKWSAGGSYSVWIIARPLNAIGFSMSPNASRASRYALLKTSANTDGTYPDYAKGETLTMVSSDVVVALPKDANFIFIPKSISSNNMAPTSFAFYYAADNNLVTGTYMPETAARDIRTGQMFLNGGMMYRAAQPIANGASISPNVNCKPGTLSEGIDTARAMAYETSVSPWRVLYHDMADETYSFSQTGIELTVARKGNRYTINGTIAANSTAVRLALYDYVSAFTTSFPSARTKEQVLLDGHIYEASMTYVSGSASLPSQSTSEISIGANIAILKQGSVSAQGSRYPGSTNFDWYGPHFARLTYASIDHPNGITPAIFLYRKGVADAENDNSVVLTDYTVEVELHDITAKSAVAPVEYGISAVASHVANDLFWVGDSIYKATRSISAGGTIDMSNSTQTTIADEISALRSAIS